MHMSVYILRLLKTETRPWQGGAYRRATMREKKEGPQLCSEKGQAGCSSSNLFSKNLESCSRLEAALNELNKADTEIAVDPSYLLISDNSLNLERIRVARSKCYEAAQSVLRSHPQTCLEKITMLDLITVYLMTVDLDQLERHSLLDSNLISSCKHNPLSLCVSVACSFSSTIEPGAKT